MSTDSLAIFERPATGIIEAPVDHGPVPGLAIPKRHIPVIAFSTLIGAAAAMSITNLQTPLYTAESSVQIQPLAANVLGQEDDARALASDAERQLNTQVQLLRSRALAARVATDLELVRKDGFYAAMGVEPPQKQDASVGGNAKEIARAADILSSNVAVSLPKDSRVAQISFTSGDPKLSASVANAYAHGLIELNLERRYASSDYARDYLSRQLGEARMRLEGSERALNDYARDAGLINLGNPESNATSGGTVTQFSLLQLNQALSNARAQRIEAEQRLRAAQSTPLMSLPEVVNNNAVQKLLSDRAAQEVALAETRQRYTAEHPSSILAATRVQQIDQQVAAIASSVRDSLEAQYQAARGQEAALASQVAGLKGQSMAEQDRSVRYNLLHHEVDTNRAMYDLLLQRQREVSTSAGVAPNNISVLDEAVPPANPSYPKPLLNLLAGLFLGFIVGVALAMLRELLDDRVRSTEEVERKLGLTTLGHIPLVRGLSPSALIASLDDPDSELGMHYTALRTSLLFSTRRGLPKSVAITSSVDGEGKSTTALATARSLASAGKQVLLIEADMRRKCITDMLDLKDDVGLSALLTGQADFAEAVQKTDHPKLDAISGGAVPPNPADILDPERFRAILNYASRGYDCVVIDAPPVADLADAPLIAAAAQNVIFVVAANAHHRGRAKASLRRLRATGATILGATLTKARFHRLALYRYRKGSLTRLGSRVQERLAAA